METNTIFQVSQWNPQNYLDQSFVVPKINCPFNFEMNPVVSSIKPAYEAWVHELIPKFAKPFLKEETLQYSVMALDTNRPELFLPMVKLTDWVFIIDDMVIEKGGCTKEYLDILFDKSNPSKDRWSSAFWTAIDELGSSQIHPLLIEKIVHEAKEWAYSAVKGINKIDWTSFSDIDKYCSFRSCESAAHLGHAIAMAKSSEYTLTKVIVECDDFKQLMLKYGGINALVNDLYSFQSEMNDKSLSNFVKINCAINGHSIQESMRYIAQYVHNGYQEMEKLICQIELQYPSNETLYQTIQSIKRITTSTVGFCSVAPRYNHETNRKALISNLNNQQNSEIQSTCKPSIFQDTTKFETSKIKIKAKS